jgi:hypothetical protein
MRGVVDLLQPCTVRGGSRVQAAPAGEAQVVWIKYTRTTVHAPVEPFCLKYECAGRND